MHRSLALWSRRISRSCRVVEIIHGPATRLTRHVTTRVSRSRCRTLTGGRCIKVTQVDLGGSGVCHDVITLFIRGCIFRILAGQRLEFLEGRESTFLAILLFGLTVCLGLDGVHPNLIDILVVTWLEVASSTPSVFPRWSASQATPSTTEEDATEEKQDPGCEGEPDGDANRGFTTSTIYPGSCQEKEGEVEDEGDHCNGRSKAGDASTTTRRGNFSDVGEKTEDSGPSCQDECDDVEDEAVR